MLFGIDVVVVAPGCGGDADLGQEDDRVARLCGDALCRRHQGDAEPS